MSESSYKVYASEEYVDQRVPPSPDGTHKMLVTDADGKQVWEDRTHYGNEIKYSFTTTVHATTSTDERTYNGGQIKYKMGESIPIKIDTGSTAAIVTAANTKTFIISGSPLYGGSLYVMLAETSDADVYDVTFYVGGATSTTFTFDASYVYGELKTLDVRFLPDTIARTSDIPAAVTDDHINELIDAKAELPAGSAARQMLVTDADGNVCWEDKPFYQEVVTQEDSVVVTTSGVNAFYDDGYGYLLNRKKYIHEGAWFTFVVGDDSVSCAATDIPATNYMTVAVGGINIDVQYRTTPKTGLFCLRLVSVYSREVYISYNYPVLRQIEEIFVPDTIARTSDIPTDDHINTLIDTKLEAAHPTELITIPASAWTGTEAPYFAMNQACSIATMTNKLIVSLSPTLASDEDGLNEMLSADTYNAIAKSKLMAVVQADGAITLAAYGKKPEIDIPVIVTEVG